MPLSPTAHIQDVDEDALGPASPTKRIRLHSPERQTEPSNQLSKDEDADSSTVSSSQEIGNHPYWFKDGDILLNVQALRFKLHRRRLAEHSEAFAGLLLGKRPCYLKVEYVDALPVLYLDDASSDWLKTLEYIYDEKEFKSKSIVFSALAGMLRISTKYAMQRMRTWILSQFNNIWPEDLDQLGPEGLPRAAEAIVLARECNVPSMLPAAFYSLSIQKWSMGAEGGCSHLILSPEDLRRLIVGREVLQDVLVQLVANPLTPVLPHLPRANLSKLTNNSSSASVPGFGFGFGFGSLFPPRPKNVRRTSSEMDVVEADVEDDSSSDTKIEADTQPMQRFCSSCRATLEQLWRVCLTPNPNRPWRSWLLRDLYRMAHQEFKEIVPPKCLDIWTTDPLKPELRRVCSRCWRGHRLLALQQLDWLKDAIPSIFLLQ